MSKLSEQRIDQARRIAIRNQLISAGKDPGVAEHWCDAWEAEAALRDLQRNADYWEAGKLWIETQCAREKAAAVVNEVFTIDIHRVGHSGSWGG